jgi:hypothetical protein
MVFLLLILRIVMNEYAKNSIAQNPSFVKGFGVLC